jgi:anti-anti-sigma regulatory factor
MAGAFDAGNLSATVSRYRRVTLVTVLGALGQHSREALRRTLQTAVDEATAAETLVAVDLRETDFTDESGWATLAAAHLRLSRVGRRLFVVLGRGQEKAAAMRGLGLDTLLTRVDNPRRLARLG